MDEHFDTAEKTCPILAAFQGNSGNQASTGKFWAVRCKRDGCGWWDDKHNSCAVSMIAQELGDMIPQALGARLP
jgi:hypothetical protein